MSETPVKEHATWSASSTAANMACPGRLSLIAGLPETTNEAADWGTCCHTLSEQCLRGGFDAVAYLGRTLRGKKHEFKIDEEMAETAQTYIDYVRRQAEGGTLLVEQRFSLASLNPPFDAGGTADAVVYQPARSNVEIVDLKGGRGVVVSAKGNGQMRTYALGAVIANPAWAFETVTVTIVQPRTDHPEGRIRSETFHTADLVEWTQDLMAAMWASEEAGIEFARMPRMTWSEKFVHAGDHCKFCPGAGFCPALEQKALDAAGVWFNDMDEAVISNRPEDFTPEVLAKRLDMLDMIQDWIGEVRAYAHRQAESGVSIPGYQLVEKIGHRAWKVAENDVLLLLAAKKVPAEKWFAKKIISPAQAEALLGKKNKAEVAALCERPVRGTNLVASAKTTRPAAVAGVNRHFDVLD